MARPRKEDATSLVPPEYESTRIPGLYIGTIGASRGIYYVMRHGRMTRLRSKINSPEMMREVAGSDLANLEAIDLSHDMRDALYQSLRRAKSR